ncbi:hypothetical protein V496_03616 [Pseudogymnoascus sp. VKM F-4515 (FW-2607)]|nr:hypothetical protein V496_03616 [Pseudogymnoascus sp. VKM F-4515 (FW-2607)]
MPTHQTTKPDSARIQSSSVSDTDIGYLDYAMTVVRPRVVETCHRAASPRIPEPSKTNEAMSRKSEQDLTTRAPDLQAMDAARCGH